jgi:hypothetical protein
MACAKLSAATILLIKESNDLRESADYDARRWERGANISLQDVKRSNRVHRRAREKAVVAICQDVGLR